MFSFMKTETCCAVPSYLKGTLELQSIWIGISIQVTDFTLSFTDKHSKASVRLNEAAENMLKTTFLLSTAFCICTIPCTIWYLLFELNVQGFSLDSNVYHLSVVAIFCNCCINPFLYSLKYREFKYAAKKLICKYEFGQDRHGHSINSTLTSLPSVTWKQNYSHNGNYCSLLTDLYFIWWAKCP